MMAFTMENYFSGQTLDDPRYVKWVATYEVVQDGKIDSKELPVYQCSDEDYAKFYPFDERSEPQLQKMRTEQDMHLYCIDWEGADIELYGFTGNYALITIVAVPCNQKLTLDLIGGQEDRIDEQCVWDLEAQREYLKPPKLVAFFNQERLNLEKYGEESIERFATLVNIQFDEKQPNWVGGYFNRNILSDQTWYMSYGQEPVDRLYT